MSDLLLNLWSGVSVLVTAIFGARVSGRPPRESAWGFSSPPQARGRRGCRDGGARGARLLPSVTLALSVPLGLLLRQTLCRSRRPLCLGKTFCQSFLFGSFVEAYVTGRTLPFSSVIQRFLTPSQSCAASTVI